MAGNAAAVLQAHHRRLLVIQSAVGTNMGTTWDRLANVDQPSAERFTKAAATLSTASVAATAALSRSMYDVLAPEIDGDIAPVVIRGGLPPAELYQRSIITSRSLLAAGATWAAAMAAGRARAVSAARTDVMLANRAAAQAQADARPQVEGFTRLLDPGACEYCASLADETYSSADAVPLHNNCGCSVAPIIGRSDPARALNGKLLDSLKPGSADVAVHEHGEMGAVITDAADEFST